MQDFKQLRLWQAARRFTRALYELTAAFPASEQFGLTAQMRRAGISVCSNIAEGSGRGGDRELRRFLRLAMGSVCEIECELILSCDLGLITDRARDTALAALDEIRRMLTAFINAVADDCTMSDSRRQRRKQRPEAGS